MNRRETWSLTLREDISEQDKKAFNNRMVRGYGAAENCRTRIINISTFQKTIL
jgi:hypothetical protein